MTTVNVNKKLSVPRGWESSLNKLGNMYKSPFLNWHLRTWCVHIQLHRFLKLFWLMIPKIWLLLCPRMMKSFHLLRYLLNGIYRHQHALSVKNISWDSLEEPYWNEGVIKYINRSRVHGTLEDNIQELKKKIESAKDNRFKAHLCSLVKVGEFIVTFCKDIKLLKCMERA